jgi:Bifunctional DNA primase/polymerase, N-terminal
MKGIDAASMAACGCCVFPVLPRDKRPAVDRWEQRACADPERVERYWPSDHHNLGIACGPSGLVTIDLDTHGNLPAAWRLPGVVDGSDVLAQLCEWAGQPWPYTRTVRTPLGGWHLIFTAPAGPEIRNSSGKLGPLVDVRACGGYIVGAGSVVDERAYPKDPAAAAIVKGGRAYELAVESDPAPLPEWLAKLAAPQEHGRAEPQEHGRPGSRLGGLIAHVRSGVQGDRNGRLHWAACRAAEMIAAGHAGRAEAEEALVSAALEAGLRGGEPEARRTFASAMRGAG